MIINRITRRKKKNHEYQYLSTIRNIQIGLQDLSTVRELKYYQAAHSHLGSGSFQPLGSDCGCTMFAPTGM